MLVLFYTLFGTVNFFTRNKTEKGIMHALVNNNLRIRVKLYPLNILLISVITAH